MLRFVLNFEFWSFEFVSDFGFSASDLVAAEQSEAAPRTLCPLWQISLRALVARFSTSAGQKFVAILAGVYQVD